MSFDDELRQIIAGAQKQHAQVYQEFIESLEEAERRVVITHWAFGLLHAVMVKTAQAMRRANLPAAVTREWVRVTLSTPHRAAVCTCMLVDDAIELDFFVGGNGQRETWKPPASMDYAQVLPSVLEVGRRIAKHVSDPG